VAVYADWANLGNVAVPFLVSTTVAALLTLGLWYLARRSGLPRAREPCATCVNERELLRTGHCSDRACAVNSLPLLPLSLFACSAMVAVLSVGWPGTMTTYILPSGLRPGSFSIVLLYLVLIASAGSSLAIAAYFLQDQRLTRHGFLLAAGGTGVFAVFLALLAGPVGLVASGLSTLALTAVLIAMGIEHRARLGRPLLGLRSVGVAALPLFLVTFLASIRIFQIVVYNL